MKWCDNVNCESIDEPMERLSDYRICGISCSVAGHINGMVLCVQCYEMELDIQAEHYANQQDYDYPI